MLLAYLKKANIIDKLEIKFVKKEGDGHDYKI
jgi:hypothetical protein